MKTAISTPLMIFSLFITLGHCFADTLTFELIIEDHLFYPSELRVPANQKIRLHIINKDPSPEEFESNSINREKIIPANSDTVLFFGPLAAGHYPFFGEYNMLTARGIIIAE